MKVVDKNCIVIINKVMKLDNLVFNKKRVSMFSVCRKCYKSKCFFL